MHFIKSLPLRQGWAAALPALITLLTSTAFGQVVTPPPIHANQITSYTGADTCLDCHATWGEYETGVEQHFMRTAHWTWVHTNKVGALTQVLGKRNEVNNYCIALPSNEARCTSCHAGVGWRDNSFDFNDPSKIDCLVCHDTTGTYKKTPTGAGVPDPTVDLLLVAQKAGRTSRATCGACHFYGGGADAVKHGDLDSTMTNPKRNLDVHMGTDGLNQSCTFCHASTEMGATAHDLEGTRYSKSAPDNRLCEKCHDAANRHLAAADRTRLESHVSRVACQSCPVPYFARGGKATAMTWDWSTAGQKNPDGTEKIIKDAKGNVLYETKKGTFTWGESVMPEYRWFNGGVIMTTLDDVINPAQRVTFNNLQGDLNDPNARLMPVKRFTGRQPYDAVNNLLVIPHLFPTNSATDVAAYWKGYNWTNAVAAGMAYDGRAFSGQVGWVNTEMFWIENHMVAPKEQALTCSDCHTPNGRLDFLSLGYPPDRALTLQTLAGFEIEVAPSGNGVQLQWMSTPGNRYQVEFSTDLANPASWGNAPAGSFTAGPTVAPMTWTDASPGAGSRFYRVVRVGL